MQQNDNSSPQSSLPSLSSPHSSASSASPSAIYFSRDLRPATWAARLVVRGESTSGVDKIQEELENRLETVKARALRRERKGEFVQGVKKLGGWLKVVREGRFLAQEMKDLVEGAAKPVTCDKKDDYNGGLDSVRHVSILEKSRDILDKMIEAVTLFDEMEASVVGTPDYLRKVIKCNDMLSSWPLCKVECLNHLRNKTGQKMDQALKDLEGFAERAVWNGEKGREDCILMLERVGEPGCVARAVVRAADVKLKNIIRDCIIQEMDRRAAKKKKQTDISSSSDLFADATKALPSRKCPEESRILAAKLVTEVSARFLKVLTNFSNLINIDPLLSKFSATGKCVVYMWDQIQESLEQLCRAICGFEADPHEGVSRLQGKRVDLCQGNIGNDSEPSFCFLPPLHRTQDEGEIHDEEDLQTLSPQPQSMWQVVPSTKLDLQINPFEETLDWRELIGEEESIPAMLTALPIVKASIYNYQNLVPCLKKVLSRGSDLTVSYTRLLETSNQLATFVRRCNEKLKCSYVRDMHACASVIRKPPPVVMLPPPRSDTASQPLRHLPMTDTVLTALQEYSVVLTHYSKSHPGKSEKKMKSNLCDVQSQGHAGCADIVAAFNDQCARIIDLVSRWTVFSNLMQLCFAGCKRIEEEKLLAQLVEKCSSMKRLSTNDIKAVTRIVLSLNLIVSRTSFAGDAVQETRKRALTLLRAEIIGTIWIHITKALDLVGTTKVLDDQHDIVDKPKNENEVKSNQNQTDEYGDILDTSASTVGTNELKLCERKKVMVRAAGIKFGEEMAELQKIWKYSLDIRSREYAFGDLVELVKIIARREAIRRNGSEGILEPWMNGWYSTGDWKQTKGKTSTESDAK